jgi:hypothetical protein
MNTSPKIIIFSTGVRLQAIKCAINGRKQWRWIAVGFEEDSYLNGKTINPTEYSDDPKKMIDFFDCDKNSKE